MKKRTTLYLQRNAHIEKPKSSRLTEAIPASKMIRDNPKIKMFKPFLHKDKSSGIYFYLGKKIKIFLGDS
jgi:hypothetical protein